MLFLNKNDPSGFIKGLKLSIEILSSFDTIGIWYSPIINNMRFPSLALLAFFPIVTAPVAGTPFFSTSQPTPFFGAANGQQVSTVQTSSYFSQSPLQPPQPQSFFSLSEQPKTNIATNIVNWAEQPVAKPAEPALWMANATLEEASSMSQSSDSAWFLDSGAYFIMGNGIARTVFGELASNDPWRREYVDENPVDTDNGLHPQNIFRLISKNSWHNVDQTLYFRINRINLSTSWNRNESNGVLLLSGYRNQDNLYYGGIRVDGTSIIKKKINGDYYDLDQREVYPGNYDRTTSPNLLPLGKWIGLRTVTKALSSGDVSIDVYLDNDATGSWIQIAHAIDDGSEGSVFTSGNVGVRTDFADVEFKQYLQQSI